MQTFLFLKLISQHTKDISDRGWFAERTEHVPMYKSICETAAYYAFRKLTHPRNQMFLPMRTCNSDDAWMGTTVGDEYLYPQCSITEFDLPDVRIGVGKLGIIPDYSVDSSNISIRVAERAIHDSRQDFLCGRAAGHHYII